MIITVDTILTPPPRDKLHVLYYRSASRQEISSELITQLEGELGCIIEIVNSWNMLSIRIGTTVALGGTVDLLLIDACLFQAASATMHEIIDMLSIRFRCLVPPQKLKLGVVIEDANDVPFVKPMQETEIMGLVPCQHIFGHEYTLKALQEMLSGHSHWPTKIVKALLKTIVVDVPVVKGIKLTKRQTEVLALVCNRGLSNKKIALALKISESTVKIHVSAILREYGVQNRTQLALAAGPSLRA